MIVTELHPWNLKVGEAKKLQVILSSRVVREDTFSTITTVAGMDIGFHGNIAKSSCVVMSYPDLEIIESKVVETSINFPYIPGLLSFREIPALVEVLRIITVEPDLFIADGQGIAHPRRFGLASHLGLLIDKPVIGCAKSRLTGHCETPSFEKGSHTLLTDNGEIIGACVRTRSGVKPVYVSIGHRISLDTAISIILKLVTRYRIPEPTRLAHQLASGRRKHN